MSQAINLKNAERNSFKLVTYTDGINDISLGIVLILMSLYSVSRALLGPKLNVVVFLGTVLIVTGVLSYIKTRIVPPRVGRVKFGTQTKKRLKNALIVTSVLVIASLATWFLSASGNINEPIWERLPQWVSDFDVDIIFTILIITFFSVAAYTLALQRFYLYGLLFGFGNLTSTILLIYQGVLFQYLLAISDLVIVGIGVYFLIRFMQSYPVPLEEA